MLPRSDIGGPLYEARLELQRALERLEGRRRPVARPRERSFGRAFDPAVVPERPVALPVQSVVPLEQEPVEVVNSAREALDEVPDVARKGSMWAKLWSALGYGK